MFYWLYYTTASVESFHDRPLVIWLQGGPGASGTGYGNFEELGPLNLQLEERSFTWVKDYNVMFLDNPVGSGFSYVDSNEFLTKTNQEIADDLVEFMKQFYQQYPQFKTSDLHIMTESYGGKMGAEFAYVLDKEIKLGNIDCKLISVGLIDSWISPIDSMISWAPFLLNLGAVDHAGHDRIAMATQLTENALRADKWVDATSLWGYTEMVVWETTHGIDFYNVLFKTDFSEARRREFHANPSREYACVCFICMYHLVFGQSLSGAMFRTLVKMDARDDADVKLEELMNGPVRAALQIPDTIRWGGQSDITFATLAGDFMKPVTDVIELLLNNTMVEVACITGQLDLIVATPGTVMWVDRLKYAEKAEYVAGSRKGISVGNVLEGYYKKAGRFHMYWVNRSGHMVPADNPAAMKFILDRLIPV